MCILSPPSEKKSQYFENCTLHHGEAWYFPPLILLSLSSHFCLAILMLLDENINKIIFLRLPLKKTKSLKAAFIDLLLTWYYVDSILCLKESSTLRSASHLHTNKTIILEIIIGYRWCRRHSWISIKSSLKKEKWKLYVCGCVYNISRYCFIKPSASLIFKTS